MKLGAVLKIQLLSYLSTINAQNLYFGNTTIARSLSSASIVSKISASESSNFLESSTSIENNQPSVTSPSSEILDNREVSISESSSQFIDHVLNSFSELPLVSTDIDVNDNSFSLTSYSIPTSSVIDSSSAFTSELDVVSASSTTSASEGTLQKSIRSYSSVLGSSQFPSSVSSLLINDIPFTSESVQFSMSDLDNTSEKIQTHSKSTFDKHSSSIIEASSSTNSILSFVRTSTESQDITTLTATISESDVTKHSTVTLLTTKDKLISSTSASTSALHSKIESTLTSSTFDVFTVITTTSTIGTLLSEVTFTASLSTQTITTDGVMTVYTTWCPLTISDASYTESSTKYHTTSTLTHTSTSTVTYHSRKPTSKNDDYLSSSSSDQSISKTIISELTTTDIYGSVVTSSFTVVLSTQTTKIDGVKTVFTTWCPYTSSSLSNPLIISSTIKQDTILSTTVPMISNSPTSTPHDNFVHSTSSVLAPVFTSSNLHSSSRTNSPVISIPPTQDTFQTVTTLKTTTTSHNSFVGAINSKNSDQLTTSISNIIQSRDISETSTSVIPLTTTDTNGFTTVSSISVILSTHTTDINGVTTVFTTWCPLTSRTDLKSHAIAPSKSVVSSERENFLPTTTLIPLTTTDSKGYTITSSVSALLSTYTFESNGITTVYTTWCALISDNTIFTSKNLPSSRLSTVLTTTIKNYVSTTTSAIHTVKTTTTKNKIPVSTISISRKLSAQRTNGDKTTKHLNENSINNENIFSTEQTQPNTIETNVKTSVHQPPTTATYKRTESILASSSLKLETTHLISQVPVNYVLRTTTVTTQVCSKKECTPTVIKSTYTHSTLTLKTLATTTFVTPKTTITHFTSTIVLSTEVCSNQICTYTPVTKVVSHSKVVTLIPSNKLTSSQLTVHSTSIIHTSKTNQVTRTTTTTSSSSHTTNKDTQSFSNTETTLVKSIKSCSDGQCFSKNIHTTTVNTRPMTTSTTNKLSVYNSYSQGQKTKIVSVESCSDNRCSLSSKSDTAATLTTTSIVQKTLSSTTSKKHISSNTEISTEIVKIPSNIGSQSFTTIMHDKSSESIPHIVSTITTITNGIVTHFTTWCPLSSKSSTTSLKVSQVSTKIVETASTSTSNMIKTSVVSSKSLVLSTVKITTNGQVTVYTTWCPLNEASTSTKICNRKECKQSSIIQTSRQLTTIPCNGKHCSTSLTKSIHSSILTTPTIPVTTQKTTSTTTQETIPVTTQKTTPVTTQKTTSTTTKLTLSSQQQPHDTTIEKHGSTFITKATTSTVSIKCTNKECSTTSKTGFNELPTTSTTITTSTTLSPTNIKESSHVVLPVVTHATITSCVGQKCYTNVASITTVTTIHTTKSVSSKCIGKDCLKENYISTSCNDKLQCTTFASNNIPVESITAIQSITTSSASHTQSVQILSGAGFKLNLTNNWLVCFILLIFI